MATFSFLSIMNVNNAKLLNKKSESWIEKGAPSFMSERSGHVSQIVGKKDIIISLAADRFTLRVKRPGGGGGGYLDNIGYLPLDPYPSIVYSVVNCRPHLSHFFAER